MTTRDKCALVPFAPSVDGPRLMRPRDACDVLHVDRRTLDKFIDAGILPSVRVTPQIIRVSALHVSILADQDANR